MPMQWHSVADYYLLTVEVGWLVGWLGERERERAFP